MIQGRLIAAGFALAVGVGTPALAQMSLPTIAAGAAPAWVMGGKGPQEPICSPDMSSMTPIWGAKLDTLIEDYLVASAAGDLHAMKKVFSKAENGGEWVSEGVIRSRAELAGHPAASAPKLSRTAMVFGGDSWTARGVWKTEPADGMPEAVYVADFRRTKAWGIWQIWRVRRYEASSVPALPKAFCTFEDEKITALW